MTARKPQKSNAGSVVPSRPAKRLNADSTAISGTPAGIRLRPPKKTKKGLMLAEKDKI